METVPHKKHRKHHNKKGEIERDGEKKKDLGEVGDRKSETKVEGSSQGVVE